MAKVRLVLVGAGLKVRAISGGWLWPPKVPSAKDSQGFDQILSEIESPRETASSKWRREFCWKMEVSRQAGDAGRGLFGAFSRPQHFVKAVAQLLNRNRISKVNNRHSQLIILN